MLWVFPKFVWFSFESIGYTIITFAYSVAYESNSLAWLPDVTGDFAEILSWLSERIVR